LFILNDLSRYQDDSGLCISYTPIKRDVCYNANLLAGEILAMNYSISGDEQYKELSKEIVNFVLSRQFEDGKWMYSEYPESGKVRNQIDFHQGYVLESLLNIDNILALNSNEVEEAIFKGANFYYKNQFYDNGRSLWRIPKKFPVEIHNQSQGIITFALLNKFDKNYLPFANTIANWTIKNMQHPKGYFYYHKNKLMDHKIPYMRWSQAWMLLALTYLLTTESK